RRDRDGSARAARRTARDTRCPRARGSRATRPRGTRGRPRADGRPSQHRDPRALGRERLGDSQRGCDRAVVVIEAAYVHARVPDAVRALVARELVLTREVRAVRARMTEAEARVQALRLALFVRGPAAEEIDVVVAVLPVRDRAEAAVEHAVDHRPLRAAR